MEINPFQVSLHEFMLFDEKAVNEIFDAAAKITEDFVEEYFQTNPSVDWIVIACASTNIIGTGSFDALPDEQVLTDLAIAYNVPIFTYSRPHGGFEVVDKLRALVSVIRRAQTVLKEMAIEMEKVGDDQKKIEKIFEDKFEPQPLEVKSMIATMMMLFANEEL